MNIIVCIKQVPDTESRIQVKEGTTGIVEEGLSFVVNPYDEYAIEEALQIKERMGGTVTLVSMGPKRAEEAIRTGLAMGADTAIHICDDALNGADGYVTAQVLAKAIQTVPHDLILCGKVAVDDNLEEVGPAIAEMLNLPQVTAVTKLEISEDKTKATAQREVEGATEVVETSLPAVFTAEKDLNQPRYPSLPNIMKAKRKPLNVMTAQQLGIDPAQAGPAGNKITRTGMFLPPPRAAGKIIPGEPTEAAKELAKLLREEAKVI